MSHDLNKGKVKHVVAGSHLDTYWRCLPLMYVLWFEIGSIEKNEMVLYVVV